MGRREKALGFLLASGVLWPVVGLGQSDEENRLAAAGFVLQEFERRPEEAVPAALLQRAYGVAVIPNVIRGGFIVGGRRGKGVFVMRSQSGEWSNPAFVTLTGGSIGAQIGAQSTDIVLVFANERAVRNITGGQKFTLGGEVSVTAGPAGRHATAATDMSLLAEVYAYASSRGLFAGAAFEGAVLGLDEDANRAFYSADASALPLAPQSLATPASARRFLLNLEQSEHAGVGAPAAPASHGDGPAPQEEAVTYPLGDRGG